HHVVHFSQGGPTKLSNLVLACSRHHHIWHKGWKLTLRDDALLELVSPMGELYLSRPPPLDFLLQ
ncbi:MAG TPA: HNH endonuclease signature motif containing protein, partial [Acidimicrobiales bacterium]|nr:HNH endonuclease signature motif containing protein [Acidimicrobiales bacterium]